MARQFQRGHKARISDLTAGTDLYVGVQIAGAGLTFDISCFGLDADEQLSDDRYFIFFNQPKSPEESIQLLGAQAGDTESFRVTLDRIPATVQKLSFTATLDGAGQMSQIGPGYIRIVAGGDEVVRYAFTGSEFTTERAVMLGDFYLKDVWRFAAVGQGFDGGLDALLRNFGGEVAEEEPAAPQQAAAPPAFGAPAFAPPAAAPDPAPSFGAPAAPPQAPPAQTPQPSSGGAATPPPLPAATPPPLPAPTPPPIHSAPTMAAPMHLQGAATPPPAPAPYAQPPQLPQQQQPPQFGQFPGQAQPPGAPAPYGGLPPGLPDPYGQQPPPGQPAPYGGPAPYGQHQPTLAGPGLQVAFEKYRETDTGQRWTPQNKYLMRADLTVSDTPVLARQGSMVMYQGKVDFSYKGAGFAGRIVGHATGQEMQLMRCTGRGQVFFAENSTHLHPIELQGDGICVSAENVLAFDETLQYEVRRIEGHGIPGGALFTMQFQGTGTVIVKTHGVPVVLPVTPTTFADCNAVVAWSSASQVIVSSQVRLRQNAYAGDSGESVNLQFRGAPGNFIIVQPYEV